MPNEKDQMPQKDKLQFKEKATLDQDTRNNRGVK